MTLDDFTYCYLNRIYRSETVLAFELVLADSLFENRALYLVNASTLREIVKNEKLHKDFEIVDGLLNCKTVRVVSAYDGLEKNIGELSMLSAEDGSFYSLIKKGAKEDYILIDDKKIDIFSDEDYVGTGFTKFYNVKISNSTMSVYCRFSTETEIYNKMLVTVPSGEIKFHPFYFGIPVKDTDTENKELSGMNYFNTKADSDFSQAPPIENTFLGVNRIGRKKINEQDYDIYYAEMMQLYTRVDIISSFINKAVSMHVKWANTLLALKHFISVQCETLAKPVAKQEWAGGNKNYKNQYGVYFENSSELIKRSEVVAAHDWLINALNEKKDINIVTDLIENGSFSKNRRMIVYLYLSLYVQSVEPTELISLAYKQRLIVEQKDLFMSLYLYEIRLNAFKSKLSFKDTYADPLAPPVLTGSDEKGYTLVKTHYKYD